MAKRDQLRRLLEIDRRIRAGEYPNPDQLSVELEVQRRTVFNDRAYLVNVLGAPLEFSRQRNGWYYSEPTWTLPTVQVTRGELLAFVLAVEAAQHPLGPVLEKELRTAVEKIGQGLQGRVEVDLSSLHRHFTFASFSVAHSNAPTLLTLHEAIENQKVVSMLYFTARHGTKRWRRVEPHHIHNSGGEWRFFAFDRDQNQMKTFNVARIESLKVLPETFARQTDFDPQKFLDGSFRNELGPETHEISVRFDSSQAPYIRERQWHTTQRLDEHADGGVTLHFQASGLGEVMRWVLQYGPHAEVLSPLSLRESVADAARTMATLYGEASL